MLNIIVGTAREMFTRLGLFVLSSTVLMSILACNSESTGTDTVPSADSTATVPVSNESPDLVVSATPNATPTLIATATQTPDARRPVKTPTPEEVIVEVHTSMPHNPGFVTMDERILRSDVIARATMNSVSADAEYRSLSDTYASMLKFRFDVHEYLKGSGDDMLTVGLTLGYIFNWAETEQEAIDVSNQWIAGDIPFPGTDYPGSDRWWDDREAIIFLKVDDDSAGGGVRGQTEQQSSQLYKFLPQNWWENEAYAYDTIYKNKDTYSIESGANRVWLPSARQSRGGVSGAGSSEQFFLLGDIVERRDNQPGQAVGAASQTSTEMSLSDLKSRISAVEDLLMQGDGIKGYEECLIRRFAFERIIYRPYEWDFGLDSGLPAGSVIDTGGTNGEHPTDYDIYLFRGADEHLFEFIIEDADQDASTGYHRAGIAKRPLPEGKYEVEYHDLDPELLPCDFTPDHTYVKPSSYWTIYATAPEGVVHEAFFDPVDIGAAVGADSTNGVLEPASFSNIEIQWESVSFVQPRATFIKEDIDAAIHGIEWDSGRVRMQLDPPSTLTDHHIDFIALDASVSLRLDFDDAVSVSDGGAGDVLTWGVCEQPWQSGDLLMLRISRSEPGLIGVTNHADCAAAEDATPTPEPIPTATPTSEAVPTPVPETMATPAPEPTASPKQTGGPTMTMGPGYVVSLGERIVEADVVARVNLNSITADATQRVGIVLYKFDVLEYLKGSGGNTLLGVVDIPHAYSIIEQEEIALVNEYINSRDTSWDDREAIVFLSKSFEYSSLSREQPVNYYHLGNVYQGGETTYTITGNHRRWLPAAAPTSQVVGASGGEQHFLLGEPPHSAGVAGQSASSGSTMTLSDLRRLAKGIESEINALGASEDVNLCVREKYRKHDIVRSNAAVGRDFYYRTDLDFESGMPQGTSIFTFGDRLKLPVGSPELLSYIRRFLVGEVDDDDIANIWLEGRNADLFDISIQEVAMDTHYGRFTFTYSMPTKRPLVSGVYRFYHNYLVYPYTLCDGYPDSFRTFSEWFVNVIAPDGTVHEAFYDPVDIGAAVGADSADGVLKPASFTYESSNATIQRIDWASGRIRMQLDPPSALTDHHIDFIDLDGNVSLRLDFDDAVSVSDGDVGDVLTWGVCEQPWLSGDLLMLRISRSEPGLTDTTNDADCAAMPEATPAPAPESIPTATPTSEAMPTPVPDATPTPTSELIPTATPMSETTLSPPPTSIPVTEPTQTATPAP